MRRRFADCSTYALVCDNGAQYASKVCLLVFCWLVGWVAQYVSNGWLVGRSTMRDMHVVCLGATTNHC